MTIDRYDSPRYKLPVVIAITCFAVLALLLTSWDSYLYDLWQHRDVIWFYSCGKAWMNGLTPYVDFADSKGPLLWLIYGVGYLLSPRSYTGVYVVSIFAYAGIFYYNYKTALLLRDEGRAWAVTKLASCWKKRTARRRRPCCKGWMRRCTSTEE